MSLALFVLCLLLQISGSDAAGGQCRLSERSVSGKALKGHTFKEVVVKAPFECQNLCESDHRCLSYNFYIPERLCEMNSKTKETKPNDFVTDDFRFYMKREDDDECMAIPSVCDANANCENTGGSYICSCKAGFTGDGKTCQDVDECVQGSHNCLPASLASCTNTAGSFNCYCNPGHIGDGKASCQPIQECQSYTNLTSADRKVSSGGYILCDNGIGPGWFRFEGSAGTRMATSCPPINRCGSRGTGWMNGTHPTVADGQVSRTVCFHWARNCCFRSTSIQVRNCSSFYVYYLSGTRCRYRYCSTD